MKMPRSENQKFLLHVHSFMDLLTEDGATQVQDLGQRQAIAGLCWKY